MAEYTVSSRSSCGAVAAHRQRGMSLLALLFVGLVLLFAAMVVTKVMPTVTEYAAIKRAVERAQKEGADPVGIRASFERAMVIDDITSLAPADLKIRRLPSGTYAVGFAYEKRIPLFGPASLLLEYAGEARDAASNVAAGQ